MREIANVTLDEFDTLDSSEKAIAILGDRWWPQAAKQEGDKISNKLLCSAWKLRNDRPKRPNDGDVSIRSRNGALCQKGCVVIGRMTEASSK